MNYSSAPVRHQEAKPRDTDFVEALSPDETAELRRSQAELFRSFWLKRRLLVGAAVAGLVISTVLAFLIPPRYTSTVQLMPPDSHSGTGLAMIAALASKGTGNGLGSMAGDLLGMKSTGALFVGVLRSQTTQDRIVQQFDLKKVYGKKYVVEAREKLDGRTAVSEDRKSGIISISITDNNPQRAAAIGNAYVDQLNTLVAELSTSAAHRERVFLEDRLKVVKQNLDDIANKAAQFSSANATLDPRDEGKAMLEAAANLAAEMIAAQSQLEGLKQIYADNNPRVRSLSARVGELRKQLDKLGGFKQGAGKVGNPATAGSSGDLPIPSIRDLPLLGVKYEDFYHQAKIQATVYELLTEQYELAKVEEAKETPSVKVLDPGKVPEKRSFPPRLVIMFLGTCVAVGLCLVWLWAVQRWERGDPADPRKALFHEIFVTAKVYAVGAPPNGDANGSGLGRVSGRLIRARNQDSSTDE
jgi:uncharacterized protein involved in exopolysaccharide biosynthesis